MSLAQRVDNFPEAWRPESGDKLVGEITEMVTAEGLYGKYSIVTVLVEDTSTEAGGKPVGVGDERSWHAFDTVAAKELKRQQPQVGDGIAAKFFGERSKRGQPDESYKAWRLLVEHRQQAEPVAHEPDEASPASGADDDVPF